MTVVEILDPGNTLNSVAIFFNGQKVKNKKDSRGKVDFKYFWPKNSEDRIDITLDGKMNYNFI